MSNKSGATAPVTRLRSGEPMSLHLARSFANVVRHHVKYPAAGSRSLVCEISKPMPMIVASRHITSAKEAGSGYGIVVYEPGGTKPCFVDPEGISVIGRTVLTIACLDDGTFASCTGPEGDVFTTPSFGTMNGHVVEALFAIEEDREFVAQWGGWFKPFLQFVRGK